MANEIQVQGSLRIRKNELVYASQPTAFQADQTNSGGPVPGMVIAGTGGVDVPFTGLVYASSGAIPSKWPAMMRIQNLDTVNFVTYGINDLVALRFFPLGELLPGESYVIRLSRFLAQFDYPETGTGSAFTKAVFHVRASQLPCQVLIEAFQN